MSTYKLISILEMGLIFFAVIIAFGALDKIDTFEDEEPQYIEQSVRLA